MPGIFFRSSKPRFVDKERVILQLKKLAKKLAEKNKQVEAVYLFGSYAQGNAGVRSDADILVILAQDARPAKERQDEFILHFSEGPIPVDVLAVTRMELQEALKEGNKFLSMAIKGVKLAGV